jgi:hypothetical protein
MTAATIRNLGLWSSIAATAAFGLAMIADNPNAGFGYYIARPDELVCLAVAMALCALQVVLYLMARGKEGDAERVQRDKRS